MESKQWRVGRKVPVNVYEGDTPVCQCQTPEYAVRIVAAANAPKPVELTEAERELIDLWRGDEGDRGQLVSIIDRITKGVS